MSLPLPDNEFGPAVREAIRSVNVALFDLIAALSVSNTPLACSLLGLSAETFEAVRATPRSHLVALCNKGVPLVTARIDKPEFYADLTNKSADMVFLAEVMRTLKFDTRQTALPTPASSTVR